MGNRLSEMNLPRFALLSDKEMKMLLVMAQNGDKAAREKLINCNLKLVFNLVQRFHNRGYDLEDLFQIGTIGLIKGIDKFDLSYDVKFSTYAVPMIIGEIRRFLRDDSPVKVSRSLKEIAAKVQKTKKEMTIKLGYEPTIGEIAKELELEREDIVEALDAAQMPASIYETIHQDDGDPIYLLDQLKNNKPESDSGKWIDNIAVKEILQRLPQRDQKILLLRFYEDKTQAEIAKTMGLSQVQISRIERQALKTLKQFINYSDLQQ